MSPAAEDGGEVSLEGARVAPAAKDGGRTLRSASRGRTCSVVPAADDEGVRGVRPIQYTLTDSARTAEAVVMLED